MSDTRQMTMADGGTADAVAVKYVTKGDVLHIAPESGPERLMRVAHVEHHIITLSDLVEACTCGALGEPNRYHVSPCPMSATTHPEKEDRQR